MQGKEVDATIKTLQDAHTRYRMREVRRHAVRAASQPRLTHACVAVATAAAARAAAEEAAGAEESAGHRHAAAVQAGASPGAPAAASGA